MACIQEVPGSNLSWDIGNLIDSFCSFPQSLDNNARHFFPQPSQVVKLWHIMI